MSDPKGKLLPRTLTMYFVMLVLFAVDAFFLKSDQTVLGNNFYSDFLGIVVMVMTVLFGLEHIKSYGLTKNKKKFTQALALGGFFSIVPLVLVTAVEIVVIKTADPEALKFAFYSPGMRYIDKGSSLKTAACVGIYAATSIFTVLFQETFFRGFLIKKFEKITDFNVANLFQSLLFTAFVLPKFIRNFITTDYATAEIAARIIIPSLICEFMSGIIRGTLTKLNGSIAAAAVDSYVCTFFIACLHIFGSTTRITTSFSLLLVRLAALIFIGVYCQMKKKKEIRAIEKARESEAEEHPHESKYSADKLPDIETISPSQFRNITESPKKISPEDKIFDELMNETPKNNTAGGLSPEEINRRKLECFKGETGNFAENTAADSAPDFEVDDFLRNFGKPQKKKEENVVPENFDVDSFLSEFSSQTE